MLCHGDRNDTLNDNEKPADLVSSRGITIHFLHNKWTTRIAGTLTELEQFTELDQAELWAKNQRYKIHGVYNR